MDTVEKYKSMWEHAKATIQRLKAYIARLKQRIAKLQEEQNPKLDRMLRVEHSGEDRSVFLVESESAVVPDGGDWRDFAHRVEIDAYPVTINGEQSYIGSCTCQDYEHRKHRRSLENNTPYRCKHLKRCRHYLMDDAIRCWVEKNVPRLPLGGGRDYTGSHRD